jgi:hypothetical protein
LRIPDGKASVGDVAVLVHKETPVGVQRFLRTEQKTVSDLWHLMRQKEHRS